MIYVTNDGLPTQGTGPNDHSDATKEAWKQYHWGKELGDQQHKLGEQEQIEHDNVTQPLASGKELKGTDA
jgi:hypothetical protein